MSRRETRGALPAEIRDTGDGISVAGYASIFNEEANIYGLFREVIMPGAFTRALNDSDTVFLVNHGGLPLARTRSGTLVLKQDEHGLHMATDLDAEDPDVAQIVPKMRRGDLDKMSFAFTVKREAWIDGGDGELPLRQIEEIDVLHDVAIVTTPAYEGTEIGLRSLRDFRAQASTKNFHACRRRLRMKSNLAGLR